MNYNVVNGTSYHPDTPKEVIEILEKLLGTKKRVRIHYGHINEERRNTLGSSKAVGQDWLEENDVYGTIGRSTGQNKVPLIVAPNDDGGPGLLDQCIVRIRHNGKDIYRHPQYHHPKVAIIPVIHGSGHHVMVNNEVHLTYKPKTSRDNTKAKCEAWVKKMGLTLS